MPGTRARIPRRSARLGTRAGIRLRPLAAVLLALAALLAPARALALDLEDESLADRPVSSVKVTIRGKRLATEQEIRNNLRSASGQPFDAKVV